MKSSPLVSLLLLIAPLVRADSNAEVVEFQAILSDVNNHLSDYISLAVNDPSFTLPSGVLDVYTQMTTYTDESYTTLFSELDFSSISALMTALPWYSSRLQPEIESAFVANSVTATSVEAQVTSSAPSSSSASDSAMTTSSSSADSSAVSEKSSSSSEATTSSAGSSSASSDSSSSAGSSSASSDSSSSAGSSSASSGSSSSAASSSQSAGANHNELNTFLGAAILGSVAMLL